ncbi:MAG: biopolymer transporter ExbD [Planctomycetia bacterium]|jgi:biopolymer transport protein ExbD|nr:biopolymer transporter ExbD [Planctomycetia bacterium]RLS77609.1 MAG: biopolymer transporter ExbD [Planctomycetota bacterium]
MARKHSDGPAKTDIDMTPMIDMTFQLITFFVFTLNFSQAVQDDRVQLPLSQLAKPAEGAAEDPITLQLMNDGKVIYTGEPIALDDVGGYLENEKRVMISAGKEPSAATVIVRADGRSRTGDVQQMIRICQEKGFERFVLRAQYDESK